MKKHATWPPRGIRAVAIGTSAGGIDALMAVLPALPRESRLAVFVVVHVPPTLPSLLVPIFGARCAVPVHEAEDKQPVEPGGVYFAPPDYHLLVDRGPTLSLSADAAVHWSRPSIDVLFESAADVYRDALLGIVLTGASQDGADGLAAVHAAGGAAVAQQPAEAQSSAMPRAALERCPAARSLALADIAALLRRVAVETRA